MITIAWESWWDPFREVKRIRREMDRMFNDFFAGPQYREEELKGWREPLTDIRETENDLIFTIELPGINKDDIQLKATEDSLEVKAESKKIVEEKEEGIFRKERSYRGFYRKMILPCKIKPEEVNAECENGVLKVRLPKVEAEKKKKAIAVKVK